jgi:hypothetical protein
MLADCICQCRLESHGGLHRNPDVPERRLYLFRIIRRVLDALVRRERQFEV